MPLHRIDRLHHLLRRTVSAGGSIATGLTLTVTALISLASIAPTSNTAHASARSQFVTTVDDTSNSDGPDATANDFLDLERSLAECISSNPPPGCGRVPTSPGDRGGWQQLVLFGVMMSGITIVFWRVARAVRRRDTAVPTE